MPPSGESAGRGWCEEPHFNEGRANANHCNRQQQQKGEAAAAWAPLAALSSRGRRNKGIRAAFCGSSCDRSRVVAGGAGRELPLLSRFPARPAAAAFPARPAGSSEGEKLSPGCGQQVRAGGCGGAAVGARPSVGRPPRRGAPVPIVWGGGLRLLRRGARRHRGQRRWGARQVLPGAGAARPAAVLSAGADVAAGLGVSCLSRGFLSAFHTRFPSAAGHLYLLSCYRLCLCVSICIYIPFCGRSLLIFEAMIGESRSVTSAMRVPPCDTTDGSAHTCIGCCFGSVLRVLGTAVCSGVSLYFCIAVCLYSCVCVCAQR